MENVKYKWKDKARAKVQAEVAGKEIERIIERDGGVTPEGLLKEAESADSPLHDCFEWNDTVAARMWRLEQASYVLRSIEVVIEKAEDAEPVKVRMFHSVEQDEKRFYTTLTNARNEPELWEQVKQRALEEIQSWQRTYRHITEFEIIFEAIEKVV